MDSVKRLAAATSIVIALVAVASLASTACGPQCSGAERFYSGGDTTITQSQMIWESSAPAGPYLPYEGGSLYHFQHHLGVVPSNVQVWLSFAQSPQEVNGGGGTPAAGNQALILQQTADEVQVENDTCSTFLIRIVVTAPNTSGATGDASIPSSD